MGKLTIMSVKGDETITWDPAKEEEVSKAKEKFDGLIAKGHLAYKVIEEKVKKAGEQIKEFDPTAGEIIVRPAVAGG